jgi:hypothetical protein
MQLKMPSGFFWQSPPPQLPLCARGALVMDATGAVIATCPNASCADAIAFHVNVANGVHEGASQ